MNPIYVHNYIKASCAFGAGFTAVHGYRHRDRREPTLNPLYHTLGFLRDGMLGAITGPFIIPYVIVTGYQRCPIPPHPPLSNL